jgi:hypothetical protein
MSNTEREARIEEIVRRIAFAALIILGLVLVMYISFIAVYGVAASVGTSYSAFGGSCGCAAALSPPV